MTKYLDTMTLELDNEWRADEVWLKIKGKRKYLFAMMDDDTRFWIAQEVADSKFEHDAISLLELGKARADKTPMKFTTDGLPTYNRAFKKVFWKKPLYANKPPIHKRHVHLKNDKNNNLMECLNGEIRDREKTFRGLKKITSPSISGIQMFHNFIRPHMGLDGDTPTDRAGTRIEGKNKILTIIKNAKYSNRD